MPSERWRRVEHVYHAVISRPEHERSSAVAELCAGDEALRREVESLLAHERAASAFLETPPVIQEDTAAGPTLVGRRVGPYSVRAPLGAGGMGEVYRASDEQLHRDVAIKILPPHFSSHRGRLARFQNEARMLAALNHPNIGAIYGHELVDGNPALVLELVEGETLSQRIARDADRPGLPVHEALTIARQIADALEAAHARGIVHRDLKPANIKITPGGVVKVLDFGLAKLAEGEDEGPDARLSHAPAAVGSGTRDGMVLGTIAYMSPEQAAGIPADARSDVWSLGVVLMEMLTGRPVFLGATDSELLAAARTSEPDWARLPAETPEPIRSLLRQCLEQDRERRLDSISAARLQIDEVLAAAAARPAAAVRSRRVVMAVALTVVLVASITAWILARPAPSSVPALPTRFTIVPPPAQPINVAGLDRDLAVSPDGRQVVYRFAGSVTTGAPLAVRPLDRVDARPLGGTERAYAPFFSFDGLWVGFFENGELRKMSIAGGPVIKISAVIGQPRGASWGDDDMIVFATDDPATGLWRVPANGGEPVVLTTPETTRPGSDHVFPSVLPGGTGVLFTIASAGRPDGAQLAALDLGTRQWKALSRAGNQPEYVDRLAGRGDEGYLVYATTGALHAERFDPIRLALTGKPVTMEERLMTKTSGAANYAVSRQGTLLFVPPGGGDEVSRRTLVWVDRQGEETPIDAPPRAYGPPRLSPDGRRVASGIDRSGNTDISVLELATGKLTRLTDASGMDGLPVWTPDGRQLVFMSDRDAEGVPNLYIVNADGSPPAVRRLTTSTSKQWPMSIDRDGKVILGFQLVGPQQVATVMAVPLNPAGPTRDLFGGNFPEISPNSRYLTHRSGASGILVRAYPSTDQMWEVASGTRSMWSRRGDELFFLDRSGALNAVPVDTSGSTFSHGRATRLFETAAKYVESKSNFSRHYDVSPDGSRFLMIKEPAPDPYATPASIIVVQQWTEELKERVR